MMDEAKTTLLMKFEADAGPIRAECPILIDSGDTLATKLITMQAAKLEVPGFRLITAGQLPRYFLISSFNFAVSLSDGEKHDDSAATPAGNGSSGGAGGKSGKDADRGHRHSPGGLGLGHRDDTPAKSAGKGSSASGGGSSDFALWRSATDDSKKPPSKKPNNSDDQLYKSHIETFTFSRLIDCSTPTLLKACSDGTSFKSASIIKRKPARSNVKNDPIDMAFMRIDFAGVKITALNFADGDVVTETCTFTCDSMQIIYAQQDPSGKLTPLSPISWQNPVADSKNRAAGS